MALKTARAYVAALRAAWRMHGASQASNHHAHEHIRRVAACSGAIRTMVSGVGANSVAARRNRAQNNEMAASSMAAE